MRGRRVISLTYPCWRPYDGVISDLVGEIPVLLGKIGQAGLPHVERTVWGLVGEVGLGKIGAVPIPICNIWSVICERLVIWRGCFGRFVVGCGI